MMPLNAWCYFAYYTFDLILQYSSYLILLIMPSNIRKYTKRDEQIKVKQELSKDVPMIVRIHRKTCPACQMSEKPWQDFCKRGVPGFILLEIEETAMPVDMMNGISGFPTYAVHNKNGENKHHTGALMSPADILKFVNTETD